MKIQNKATIPETNIKTVDQQQQKQQQQIEDTLKFTISDNTNNNTERNDIYEYQKPNKAILDNSVETTNKYRQQETINSIHSLSDNSIILQQNIFTTFQSVYSKYINEIFKTYWNNFLFPTAYLKLYSNSNQIIIDNTINTSRISNDFLKSYIEIFNNSMELAQKYYNDGIRNYFNFGKK